MVKKIFISISVLSLLWVLPLPAQDSDKFDKFTFSVGGGVSTPLNPTAQYAGVSANFVTNVGYKLNRRSSLNGEFMWNGLPGSVLTFRPPNLPTVKSNVYLLGANYRYQIDRLGGSPFGVYAIGGGGWYYRYISLDQDYTVPPSTTCQPIYTWWGYTCDSGGYVTTETIAKKGASAGGVNAGVGFSVALGRSWKFFTEARYHYAFSENIATTMVPVTLGLRFN